MKSRTKLVLKILYILSWIILIGVSIEAGGFIFNSFFTLLLNPVGARHFWQEVDLSALYYFDRWCFFVLTFFMSLVSVLKACIFYKIIWNLHPKVISMSQPFSPQLGRFIFKISYLSLFIGFFCLCGAKYVVWLDKQGLQLPGIQDLRLGGADVWLFMGVALFVVAQIFKRGIEIQSENELTV